MKRHGHGLTKSGGCACQNGSQSRLAAKTAVKVKSALRGDSEGGGLRTQRILGTWREKEERRFCLWFFCDVVCRLW